jgi:2-oxoglutarate dehydrogenase E1 component
MNNENGYSSLNEGYILDLYERYQRNPKSVDPTSREIFRHWTPPGIQEVQGVLEPGIDAGKMVHAANYASAIRTFGHLAADLYPLGGRSPGDPALKLATYNLDENELRQMPASVVGGPAAEEMENAFKAIQALLNIYTRTTGYDYGHIQVPEERNWLQQAAEAGRFRPPSIPLDMHGILARLTQVEVFEQFLHRFFPGKTRFSIEGLDIMIPMLDEIIDGGIRAGVCMAMIGMAHRGRLNVMAHILSKPYEQIMAEFKDPRGSQTIRTGTDWTGDVTYHKGGSRAVINQEEVQIVILLPPNPSHLEHVNPVIEGMVRAAQSGVDKPGSPRTYPEAAIPILIHGDAAFPGEGIVSETLNLSRLEGYTTFGTVHIIANNQLGFTTAPEEGRSTLYASDLAKGFEIPIIHVNADDPEACIEAARTAIAYREEFHKDFLIDLIGYRRYGHNEGDEPGFTQPRLYESIRQHPSVRKLWADKLMAEGLISKEEPDPLIDRFTRELQTAFESINKEPEKEEAVEEEPSSNADEETEPVSIEQLKLMNEQMLKMPDGFSLNPKLDRAMQRRRSIFNNPEEKNIDWAAAEELALASILTEGVSIRFTGQDVERGTFSQRHAVFFDVKTGMPYIPLQHLSGAKSSFEIYNSPLSENSAVGFEYGYNIFAPDRLDIWEAQYGDFINAAQGIVDEFIVSGRAKWGQEPSLVLLLPHGYEGQGPDHSGGRMERFLQMAAKGNMRIANCTTSAQYFHLLHLHTSRFKSGRYQPLVIFTPKSLLRNPQVASSSKDLAEGHWQPVLDDDTLQGSRDKVSRLIFCTGKLGVEMLSSKQRSENPEIAIIRIEQLYPFPSQAVRDLLLCYPEANELIWVQEEPENMGAWNFMEPRLRPLINSKLRLGYIGRASSSSPAEGSMSWHSANQEALINQAFTKESQELAGIVIR